LNTRTSSSAPTATMEDHYRTNGWGAFPFASIATLRPMGGRPAPVPYPQLSMKAPLENMICRTDHQDKGQTTWQVGTQWGDKCIYFFAGRQDMNGAARSHVLMVDPNIASRFKFEPVRTEVIKKGKGGTGRATVIANKGLVRTDIYGVTLLSEAATVTEIARLGTRLTHITRAMRLRDPERAIIAAGETVEVLEIRGATAVVHPVARLES